MAEENRSSRSEPPKNFIAASIAKARDRIEQRDSFQVYRQPQGAGGQRSARRPLSNALGNLFLLVILVSLLSIPVLVYFTDTGARVKREIRKVVAVMGVGTEELESELKSARERVEQLEKKVDTLQAANTALTQRPEEAVQEQAGRAENETTESTAAPEEKEGSLPVPSVLPREEYELTKIFNGVGVRATLDLREGSTATEERADPESYEFEMKLKVAVPEANQSVADLAALNPHLPLILPDLDRLVDSSRVSPLFEKLYGLKHERIKYFLARLDKLETRHNYFDCETMLELTHPGSSQRALLVQGEMDVVADGSDGDRLPTVADYVSLSTYYQPMTSYGWPKRTSQPNPLLPRLEKQLEEVLEEYAIKGLSAERNRYLRNRRDQLKRYIADLKARSYLVAEADPFIVLPLKSVLGQPGAPTIGDYAVVVHEKKVYPAICGDAGPSWKFGEASLMVAKTINENASPYSRPVSDLKVTYLIFPDSADPKKGPPDLDHWKARCAELLDGLGGLGDGFELHDWRNIVAERRAKREVAGMVEEARSLVAEAKENASQAAVLAEEARNTAEAARKRREQAEAASESTESAGPDGGGVDLEALRVRAEEAGAKAEEAAMFAQAAEEAAKSASNRIPAVEAAVETVLQAVAEPYHVPKTETTDVALAALEEARQTMAQIELETIKTRLP